MTEDKVVRAEKVAERTRSNRIHGSRLEVDQNGTGNILVGPNLVVVNVDPFQLKIVISLVETIPLNAMLVRDDFPELGTYMGRKKTSLVKGGAREKRTLTNLVTTLSAKRKDFSDTENIELIEEYTWPVCRWTISRMLKDDKSALIQSGTTQHRGGV